MANDLLEKLKLMKEEGFYTVSNISVFWNPEKQICFSLGFLEDHSIEEIRQRIKQADDRQNGIRFEFGKELPAQVREYFESFLPKTVGLITRVR